MIDENRVNEIFLNCLFKEGEDTSSCVLAKGIQQDVGFHPTRIKEVKTEVGRMLAELPDSFMCSKGGGSSFLNLCVDKDGNQWTGLHQRMEQLIQLGIATKQVESLVEKPLAFMLPGGMPYYKVLDSELDL